MQHAQAVASAARRFVAEEGRADYDEDLHGLDDAVDLERGDDPNSGSSPCCSAARQPELVSVAEREQRGGVVQPWVGQSPL